MTPPQNHFTTWDDPAILTRVVQLVTGPKSRDLFIHECQADCPKGKDGPGQEIDITSTLNKNGIPTSQARVYVKYDLATHSAHIHVRNGGTNWKGAFTVELTKD
jgi:hypothetical protein